MFEKPPQVKGDAEPNYKEIEAKKIAQEKIDSVEKRRDRLGSVVLNSLTFAFKGYAAIQRGERFGEVIKRGASEIFRKADVRGEEHFTQIVREYEDKIELAVSDDEKERLSRELESIKNRWETAQKRHGEDIEKAQKYMGWI
jgi:hypothetical protein